MINSIDRRFFPWLVYILFSLPFFGLAFIISLVSNNVLTFFQAYGALSPTDTNSIILFNEIIILVLLPFVGYLVDKNFKFTKKLGRYYPWIIISGVILAFLPLALFSSDLTDYLAALIFTSSPLANLSAFFFVLIYEVVYLFFRLAIYSLIFNKFRNTKERLIISTLSLFLDNLGGIISIFIFADVITYYRISSYFSAANIAVIVFLIFFGIGQFGLLEESQLLDIYSYQTLPPRKAFFKDFFQKFSVFKNKNFVILALLWVGTSAFSIFFLGNLSLYLHYILNQSVVVSIFYNLTFIFSSFIGIPVGFVLSWFIGQRKTYIISGFLLATSLILFPFLELIQLLLMSIMGIALTLTFITFLPLMGDVFDQQANITKKRSDGFYYGTINLFNQLTYILGPIIILNITDLTGFDWSGFIHTDLANWGLLLNFTLIPGVIILITTILFGVFFDLKSEKIRKIQADLKELII